jgi:hypothetical protein
LSGKVLTLQQNGYHDDQEKAIHEVELSLTLEDPRPGDNLQVWHYRYDCIVNKEYPGIALEIANVLIRPSVFRCSQNQLVDIVELKKDTESNLCVSNVGKKLD